MIQRESERGCAAAPPDWSSRSQTSLGAADWLRPRQALLAVVNVNSPVTGSNPGGEGGSASPFTFAARARPGQAGPGAEGAGLDQARGGVFADLQPELRVEHPLVGLSQGWQLPHAAASFLHLALSI